MNSRKMTITSKKHIFAWKFSLKNSTVYTEPRRRKGIKDLKKGKAARNNEITAKLCDTMDLKNPSS